MSLFEKLNNKRYDLQEKKKRISSSASSGNNNSNKNISTSRRNIRKAIADLDATQPEPSQQPIQTGRTTYNKNKKVNDNISQKRTRETLRRDQINRQYGIDGGMGDTGGSEDGLRGGSSQTSTKTKTVKQSEVSQKAKDFTKEINKKNKNRTFFDPEKAKEARKNLIAKRKEYGIDRKGNISDAGVERYAKKTKQLSSGSNVPAKVTTKDLKVAKVRAVGGEKVTNSAGKVIGTTTGKYGGRLGRARNKNMKTYDQIKKDIDLKDLQKASDAKARKIARSQELRDLNKKMGEKQLYDKITFKQTQKSIRPQRQFYKGAMKPARVITKAFAGPSGKVAPVVKTGLKVVAKAGPVGAIAAGAGLSLLNPSIRKGAKKVAKAALKAAGVKSFMAKPKTVSRPPSKIGINLSPKA